MALPPAQPLYILRGHSAQIHAAEFVRSNARLVTGDAEGWIVLWDLAIKRPTAVWRAHEGAVLGVSSWGSGKLITHGKDNKLIVWKLSEEDEASMSKVLPVDTPPEARKQPWLLHVLEVNTMNFCSFAQLDLPLSSDGAEEELLVAVPNTLSSETVDIFHFPSSKRIHTLPASPTFKGGMIMALSLFYHPINDNLTVIAGFESGHTSISQNINSKWKTIYTTQAHTQPILSLDLSPSKDYYLTSSADAIITKHTIPSTAEVVNTPMKILNTKHAGQQGLQVRKDGKIFATAGWDSRVRVYSCKGMKELAVLKWHKEGCYAISFADVEVEETESREHEENEVAKREQSMTVREERMWRARNTHWLAVGSKDGKISLWDIY